MNALVPQGKPKREQQTSQKNDASVEPTDRRRFVGFILLLLAVFILLPELQLTRSSEGHQQQVPQLQPWVEPSVDARFESRLNQLENGESLASVKPAKVPKVQLEQVESSWSDQYHQLKQQAALDAQLTRQPQQPQPQQPQPQQPQPQQPQPQQEILSAPEQVIPTAKSAPAVEPAFMVQVGTFKQDQNATQLIAKLDALGYKAFSRAEHGFVKVMIGPQLRRKDAEQARNKLANDMALQGIIKAYSP